MESQVGYEKNAPNTACSRPAQLPKLGISFDGWRSGRWRAADAQPLGRLSRSQTSDIAKPVAVAIVDKNEALDQLGNEVSGYFCDDFAVELMRTDYLASQSHSKWIAIRLALATAMKQCTDTELNEFVAREFNLSCTSPQEGRETLSYIYDWVFKE